MANFTRGLVKWFRDEGLSQIFHVLVLGKWPVIWAFAVGVSGYMQHLPTAELLLMMAGMFGIVAWSLVNFQQYLIQITTKDKIILSDVELRIECAPPDEDGKIATLNKAKLLIGVRNRANFPIYCFIDDMFFSVEGRVELNPAATGVGHTISAMSETVYHGPIIPMDNTPFKPIVEGLTNFTIRYGRQKGREKYSIPRKLKLATPFNPAFRSFVGTQSLDVTEHK